MSQNSNLPIPTFEQITAEGIALGVGMRLTIPRAFLPHFEAYKEAYRAKHGRIISREQILYKAIIHGLPGLLEEAEAINQPEKA